MTLTLLAIKDIREHGWSHAIDRAAIDKSEFIRLCDLAICGMETSELIAKLEAALKLAREALRPFAASHFNDNGEITTSTGHLDRDDYWKASDTLTAIYEVLK